MTTASGCPKRPSWAITAARVLDDPATGKVRFVGGHLQLFGVSVPLLPIFAISRGKEGATGWLAPDFSISSRKGFEIAEPYHWQIGPNRDLTLTPHVYTGVFPAIEAKYRQLDRWGAFQVGGFLTYGTIESIDPNVTSTRKGVRGYFEANGKAQLDPLWSITTSLRVASDKTLTRRYDITNDDRLRNVVNAERISPDSYISIAGWAFEGLRAEDRQKQIPIALPAIDARFRKEDVFGGTLQIQGNSLVDHPDRGPGHAARLRQRGVGFAAADPMGPGTDPDRLRARRRLPHRRDREHRGPDLQRDRWLAHESHRRARRRPQMAVDRPAVRRHPAPHAADSVGADSAHAEHRHPQRGCALDRPRGQQPLRAQPLPWLRPLGRRVAAHLWGRLVARSAQPLDQHHDRAELPARRSCRTSSRKAPASPTAGRTSSDAPASSYGRLLELTHRFRIDKDNFAVRRNEIDLTIGTAQTYAQIGYLKLNRDIDPSIEDLRDVEEVRVGGRMLFSRYWSIFGAAVIDLTDSKEDPLSVADGWEPVRDRLGIQYEDDCIQIGLTWKRDYERIGTFRAREHHSASTWH